MTVQPVKPSDLNAAPRSGEATKAINLLLAARWDGSIACITEADLRRAIGSTVRIDVALAPFRENWNIRKTVDHQQVYYDFRERA